MKDEDEDEEEQNVELQVSDSEEEKKKKKILQKEKRDARAPACLSANRSSALSAPLVPGSFAPSVLYLSAPPMPGWFAPPMPGLSALPILNFCSASAPSMSSYLSAPPVSSSRSFPPVPGSSSASALPMLGLSVPHMLVISAFSLLTVPWSSPHIASPRTQRFIKCNRRVKRASLSEELAPITLLLLPSINIKRPSFVSSPVLFLSGRGVKRLLDKIFDLDYRLLTNNSFGKEVDRNFADCQCLQAVKTNKM